MIESNFTPEQELMRLKIESSVRQQYAELIRVFSRNVVFKANEEQQVLTTAFGVDTQKIFLEQLREYVEKAETAISNMPSKGQTDMFDAQNDERG